MAKTNYTAWKADLDTKIYENVTKSITATNLNQILTDLGESVDWSISQRVQGETLGTQPIVITLPVAMPAATYSLLVRAYDIAGDPIDYRITDILTSSFTIAGAVPGLFDYNALY